MRSLTSGNTPPGCNDLSTPSEDLQGGHHRQRKPDSSRFSRNIRPSSLSPAPRNPAATSSSASSSISARTSSKPGSSLRPDTGSPAVNRKPSVAQLRARTTDNSTGTPTKAKAKTDTSKTTTTSQRAANTAAATAAAAAAEAAAATGPPTATGPRRITATTTTIGSASGTTKTSSSSTATATTTTTTTTTATAAANPNNTSSNPPPTQTTATTTTTSTTPSSTSRRQQPALSPNLRTPLRNRDQNVLNPSRPATAARAKPSPTPSPTSSASASAPASASSTPTMPPYDKGNNTTSRQPGVPSLSAKGATRAPLTPKVAAKSPPVITPLGRRRNDNSNNNTNYPTLHANAGGAREDITSPAPFLRSNNTITPRSESRQSRVNSNNSTPNGTPNPERDGDWDHQSTFQGEPIRRQVVTFSPAPSTLANNRHDAAESKFFYASDAKSSAPPPQAKSQPKSPAAAAPPRASTFMYANGSAVERNRPTSPGLGFTPMLAPSLAPSLAPRSPPLAPTSEPPQSKFFYANGAPNLSPGFRPSSATSGGASTPSESRKLARTSAGSAGAFSMAQRPLSPSKPAQAPTSAPLAKSSSQPHGRAQMTSPPPLAPSIHKRKISTDAVSQTASYVASRPPSQVGSDVASTDAMIMSRFMTSQSPTPSEMPSPTMSSFFPNQPLTIASILQAADEISESEDEDEEESEDLEEVHSPTKSTHGDPLNDMVVNARRERKVQDLEITNASLEAINRSLERQLRKQTAELRRYKRLSRSGRLPVSEEPPSQVPPESVTGDLGIENLDLPDLSEEEDADDGLEDLDDSMLESSELSETDSAASPKQDPDRDARRRQRDEKRLQLDLTKHKDILVDSQKINQSIKRCLNWTEELIKEGKKALEYNIRPHDVELPPRVLQPLYLREENEEEGRKDDASSVPGSPAGSPKSLTPPQWSKEPQDRDSGIELRTIEAADGG